ncbi:MAG TPA: lipocalin family protein [Nocardioidaceae bacterium]|nr:lipocalin family protein [Nocardioidaceae bacterium]
MFRTTSIRSSRLRTGLIATLVAMLTMTMVGPAAAVTPSQFVDQNERAHTTQMEWWYITGHLSGVDSTGKTYSYGFQDTYFKNHPWWGYDGYSQHMAVTDLNRGTYTQGNKNGTGFTSTACCAGYNVGIDDWDLQGDNGWHRVYGNVNWGDYILDLTLMANKPAAPHGGDGFVDFAPFGDSGYYSWTGLNVGGTVWDHGVKVTVTGGEAWMDHQWFDGGTTAGWDWYSIQLDNGVDYMVFLVRGPNGQYSEKFGTRVAANGAATELTPSQLTMTPLGSWTSPRSGRVYSSGWQVNVPGGTFTITPKLLDQESNLAIPDLDYWEGASSVTGTLNGVAVTGKSYTEITPVQCLCGF